MPSSWKVAARLSSLKRFLRKQPPAQTLAQLQKQLDCFRDYYNHHRPHRALDRQTPIAVFNARLTGTAFTLIPS